MSTEKFYGNHRGEVVRNDDPMENGRVQVRIFGVFDEIEDDDLPWAQYADPMMGGETDVGGVLVPEVGAHVWTFFEGGDWHFPVYWAGAPAMNGRNNPDLPTESRENGQYPHNKVFKTKNGIVIELDDTEGAVKIRVHHPSGTMREIDAEGNVNEEVSGDVTSEVFGDVIVRAPTIQLGEDGAVEQSVLGLQLQNWINGELVPWLNSHNHIGNLGSPTSAAIAPFEPGTAEPGGGVWSKVNTNQ